MSFKNGGVYETYLQENHVQTYRLILWLTFWSTIVLVDYVCALRIKNHPLRG